MQEARHYGYSQIHIEIPRKEFIIVAFAIESLEITRPFGNRPTQKHGASSNEVGSVAALQRFLAFTQHIFTFGPQFLAQG